MAPLVAQSLACNVTTLRNCVAYVLTTSWYVMRKLYSDAGDELARVTNVSAASREEEASYKALLFEAPPSDSPRNRRLPCACQAAQPEDAWYVLCIRPAIYLVKEVDACVGEAGGFMLLCV